MTELKVHYIELRTNNLLSRQDKLEIIEVCHDKHMQYIYLTISGLLLINYFYKF